MAIELLGSVTPSVEEGDTLQLRVNALDASGEVVPDAVITWELIDVDSGQIGFGLDTLTGAVAGLFPSSGRVQARLESLRSGPIRITVTGAPDSIAAASAGRQTLEPAATTSDSLITVVLDLTTQPGVQLALADKLVHYRIVDPPPGGGAADGLFVSTSDSVSTTDPRQLIARAGADGRAWALLGWQTGTVLPESASVDAIGLTARGDTVAGSPVRFVIVFP